MLKSSIGPQTVRVSDRPKVAPFRKKRKKMPAKSKVPSLYVQNLPLSEKDRFLLKFKLIYYKKYIGSANVYSNALIYDTSLKGFAFSLAAVHSFPFDDM